jgi:hemerythrin
VAEEEDTVMPIVWRDQMSLGNNIIDQDHKYLICLINSVELALKHEDTMELLPVYIHQLVAYTREHFEREEVIQKKALYPLQAEHKREHEKILGKLKELVAMTKDYTDQKKADELSLDDEAMLNQRIMDLARTWIVDHLLKEDRRMEHYLRKLPKTSQ